MLHIQNVPIHTISNLLIRSEMRVLVAGHSSTGLIHNGRFLDWGTRLLPAILEDMSDNVNVFVRPKDGLQLLLRRLR